MRTVPARISAGVSAAARPSSAGGADEDFWLGELKRSAGYWSP